MELVRQTNAGQRMQSAIRRLLAERDMTLAEFSRSTGAPYMSLYRCWRWGRELRYDVVRRLADWAGVGVETLLGEVE